MKARYLGVNRLYEKISTLFSCDPFKESFCRGLWAAVYKVMRNIDMLQKKTNWIDEDDAGNEFRDMF